MQDGLADNYINAIIEDDEGQLWIGSNRGITLFNGTNFQTFIPPNGQSVAIQDMAFDHHGRLWAATLGGIYFLDQDSILQKEGNSNVAFGRMYATLLDSNDQMWMAGEKGIFKYTKSLDKWQKAWSDNAEVLDLAETVDGQLWAAVYNYGLVNYDGRKWNLEANTNLPPLLVTSSKMLTNCC